MTRVYFEAEKYRLDIEALGASFRPNPELTRFYHLAVTGTDRHFQRAVAGAGCKTDQFTS